MNRSLATSKTVMIHDHSGMNAGICAGMSAEKNPVIRTNRYIRRSLQLPLHQLRLNLQRQGARCLLPGDPFSNRRNRWTSNPSAASLRSPALMISTTPGEGVSMQRLKVRIARVHCTRQKNGSAAFKTESRPIGTQSVPIGLRHKLLSAANGCSVVPCFCSFQ